MKLPSYQDLSKEQDAINNLPLEGNYLVTGPPGTGKTVMALYRAQMLSISDYSVDLIMYSKLLSWYTERAVGELQIEGQVCTYHKWMHWFWRECYGTNPPMRERWKHDWQAAVAQLVTEPPEAGSVPHLIIDEAQDLPKDFFFLARYLASNLMIFADENQRLTEDNSTISEIERSLGTLAERHELRRNYRNTREIARLARRFCVGDTSALPDLPERIGERPILRRFDSTRAFGEFLARYERNNSDREIGVLCRTTSLQRELERDLRGRKCANPVQMYVSAAGKRQQRFDFDIPGIKIVNFQSMKGLEFDTVFLPELQRVQEDPGSAAFRMTMYVAVSRAREELYLTWSGPGPEPAVVSALPSDLVEVE
jgi:superfamily I DNA/RNA helicase